MIEDTTKLVPIMALGIKGIYGDGKKTAAPAKLATSAISAEQIGEKIITEKDQQAI